jgi:2-polyprenyl-3-methyl-5-hydroxy-6-metoxy-1,4-benzoquinol methylase
VQRVDDVESERAGASDLGHSYAGKRDDYFGNVRREILPLLPPAAGRVLELGCGRGDTLAFLKREGRCTWAGGVELFPEAAAVARGRVDWLLEGDVERLELDLEPGSLDAVLCLDVLEHLVDPWRMIRRLSALVRPGGAIVASIPNVRHARVVFPLLFGGSFEYTGQGLLDRTHLRFFTRRSAVELLECGGLRVDAVHETGFEPGTRARVIDALTFSALRPLFTLQYVLRATKVGHAP